MDLPTVLAMRGDPPLGIDRPYTLAVRALARLRPLKPWINRWLPGVLPIDVGAGFRLFVDPRDTRGPSFHVLRGGAEGFRGYEAEQKQALLERLEEGSVFLDIGANIGHFTFEFAQKVRGLNVYAFEPHPSNANCFEQTLKCNAIDRSRIYLHRCAVGARSGHLDLFLDETDSGGHSLIQGNLWNNRHESRSIPIEVIALDDFAPLKTVARVDAMKIDVQGVEDAVLRGARRLIERDRPTILVEIQNERVEQIHAIVEALSGLGYGVREVGRGTLNALVPLERLPELTRGQFKRGHLFSDYLLSDFESSKSKS